MPTVVCSAIARHASAVSSAATPYLPRNVKRVRDVRAVDFVATARVPLTFCQPDGMEQRGDVREFGIECDAAAHIDVRCKCEYAHRIQERELFGNIGAINSNRHAANDSVQKRIRNGGVFITRNRFIGESWFRLLPAPETVMCGAGQGEARMPDCDGARDYRRFKKFAL